jgi:hypothetical protein
MILSGIHDFSGLQTGFPIGIASGMKICEGITLGIERSIGARLTANFTPKPSLFLH